MTRKSKGLLLDTHVFYWWMQTPQPISQNAFDAISDPRRAVFFSVAGAWEIWIKQNAGHIRVPDDLEEVLAETDIRPLEVTLPHAARAAKLPLIHRDPFDRLMIGQALEEDLVLVTRDAKIPEYDVPTIKA